MPEAMRLSATGWFSFQKAKSLVLCTLKAIHVIACKHAESMSTAVRL